MSNIFQTKSNDPDPNKSKLSNEGLKLDVSSIMQRFKGQNLFTPTANMNQYGLSTIDIDPKTGNVKLSEEDMNTLKEQIIEAIRDCANRSSVHAFPSLSTKGIHPSIVIIWILCLMASWGYLIYQIYNSIVLFTAYGVSSSISVQFEAPTQFPAVDICNLNAYDNSFGDAPEIMNETLTANGIYPTSGKYDTLLAYTDAANDQFKAKMESLASTGEIDIKYQGFYLSQMLISCYFEGKNCTDADFYYYHDYYYGNCYRFNGGSRDLNQSGVVNYTSTATRTTSKTGWRNGLRLELYTGSQTLQQRYNYKAGFRVIVHNQSVVPFPDEDGIDVSVGLQSNIAVTRTFVYHQGSPYSNCIDTLTQDSASQNDYLQEMYNQIKQNIIAQYMQKYCLKLCYQYYIIDKCKCKSLSFTYLTLTNKNASGCVNVTDLECLSTYGNTFYDSGQVNVCYASCPIECNVVTYELNTRIAAYPSEWYAQQFKEYQTYFGLWGLYNDLSTNYSGPNYDLISKTTAMVNVFYQSLQYEVVTESPILTFDLLLANIGGNLGLFTGMSFLSIVEFVEAALTVGIIVFIAKKARLVRPTNNNN